MIKPIAQIISATLANFFFLASYILIYIYGINIIYRQISTSGKL